MENAACTQDETDFNAKEYFIFQSLESFSWFLDWAEQQQQLRRPRAKNQSQTRFEKISLQHWDLWTFQNLNLDVGAEEAASKAKSSQVNL